MFFCTTLPGPEMSLVIEAMLSKTDINIYVVAATRRADTVPWGNNSLLLNQPCISDSHQWKKCPRISHLLIATQNPPPCSSPFLSFLSSLLPNPESDSQGETLVLPPLHTWNCLKTSQCVKDCESCRNSEMRNLIIGWHCHSQEVSDVALSHHMQRNITANAADCQRDMEMAYLCLPNNLIWRFKVKLLSV